MNHNIQVKLEDPKNPDNVNWYKVTDDGDELLDDTDNIVIEKARGESPIVNNFDSFLYLRKCTLWRISNSSQPFSLEHQ